MVLGIKLIMFEALRDIKTFVDSNNDMSHNIIKKGDIVILLSEDEIYSEYYSTMFIKYKFLSGDIVHLLNGRFSESFCDVSLDDAWHDKFFIKDFNDEERYLWKNTFKKIN